MSAATIRRHVAFLAPAFSNTLAYRTEILMWYARGLFVFVATAWMWLSVYGGRSGGGYDSATIFTYIFVAALIQDFIAQDDQDAMAEAIVDGKLSAYLTQPVSYLWRHAVMMIPVRGWVLAVAPLKILVFLALFPGIPVVLPSDPFAWISFSLSLALAVGMFVAIDLLNGMLAFWFHRAYGVRWMVTMMWVFLSGAYMPIGLLPDWLRTIVMATPFPYLIYAPVAQLVGPETQTTRLILLGTQVLWIVALSLAVKAVWAAGLKRYEAAGS